MRTLLLSSLVVFALATTSFRAPAQNLSSSDYKITSGDTVIIDVFGEKDLSREFAVSVTGTINYFFLGEFAVAGKTTAQVREELTTKLNAEYLVDPQIAVDVKTYRIREVFVNGQVNKPGAILITGEQELRITDAIARAGGLTTRASKNKIVFTRPSEKMEKVLSWEELLRRPELNVALQPGDIIDVGDKLI
jgi:polysaccharide biosynthesis/export protein VpsN